MRAFWRYKFSLDEVRLLQALWEMRDLGDIAQLVEHFNGIEGVSGSNPLISID